MATHIQMVSAQIRITNTPINLAQGQVCEMDALGQWSVWPDGRHCGPAGGDSVANNGGPNGNWPAPGLLEGCLLIYRNNQIVGQFSGPKATVTGPGVIGFGPNDNLLTDNSGDLQVDMSFK